MATSTYPRLLGVRVIDSPPIADVHIALSPGLTVLYGRNGAGKTRVLEGIEEAVGGGAVVGKRTLFFEWVDNDDANADGSIEDDWYDLPGNPWPADEFLSDTGQREIGLLRAMVYGEGANPSGRDREEQLGYRAGFDEVVKMFFNIPVVGASLSRDNLAFDILNQWNLWQFDAFRSRSPTATQLAELTLHAEAALEIARQGRWAIHQGDTGEIYHDFQSGSSSAAQRSRLVDLRLLGAIDEGTPALRRVAAMAQEDPRLRCGLAGWTRCWVQGADLYVHNHRQCDDEPRVRPVWSGEPVFRTTWEGGFPVTVVSEAAEVSLNGATLDAIAHRVGLSDDRSGSVLVRRHGNGCEVSPDALSVVEEFSRSATSIYRLLLEDAPRLTCQILPIDRWPVGEALNWKAVDFNGSEVSLDHLSRAQLRWARLAVRLAILQRDPRIPTVLLIDEPESALHRRAERHLFEGLHRLCEEWPDLHVIVATHSPAFLKPRSAQLIHVHRGRDGSTELDALPQDLRRRVDELGLGIADLVQLCRTILLVEGQHELVILEALLGDTLREMGVEMLCMRGAARLKTWDAQLIERFTDVPVVVLVDNDQALRLHEIWDRARAAAAAGKPHIGIIHELKSGGRGSEGEFLRELCINLISGGQPERFNITAFGKPDIPEYLNLRDVAPAAPPDMTWEQLRSQNYGQSFKAWMEKVHKADYGDENLRRAALNLDRIPSDFTDLLLFLEERTRARQVVTQDEHPMKSSSLH